MYYPEELVEEIRTKNDIVAVISQYVRLTKRGGNYFGVCPFHNEKTPSFSVAPAKQMYYCFGCGAGGNVITFVMEYEHYTFEEALKYLAERVGVALPEGEATEEQKKRAGVRSSLLDINREAATFYYYQLKTEQGTRAKKYLTGRGLSEETIRKFGLGYSPMYGNTLYQYLRKKGYSDSLLSQSGLVKISEKGVNDRFWNRAMFPIMDGNSRVIGFGGRVMGEGEPKYLNSPETILFDKSRNLYGLNLARLSRKPYFLICEGYMDVIAMHQAGFDCAVASLGTAFTSGHVSLIKRYVKEVVLTYDSDNAGIKAALRAIPILKSAGISVRVLNMKPYKDPDEFISHEGAEAFQKRIDEAINSFLFECDVLRMKYEHEWDNPEKKTEFHREVAGKLTEFPDELERNNYLEAVCFRYQIPADSLRDMVRRIGARRPVSVSSEASENDYDENGNFVKMRQKKKRDKEEGLLEAQRLLLNWGFSDNDHPDFLMKYLDPEDFSHELFHDLAETAWAAWKQGKRPEAAAVINRYMEDEEKRSETAAVFNTVLPEGLTSAEEERILTESIRRLRKASLDAAARKETDPRKLQDIILEKAKWETLHISL